MSKKEPKIKVIKIVKTLEEKRAAKALAMKKYRAKLREKDPEGFLAKQRYDKQQQRLKKKGMKAPALPVDLPPEFYPAPPVPVFKVPPPPKNKPKKMAKSGIPPPPPNKPKKPKPPPNKPMKKITPVPKLKNISKKMQDELNLMYYDINKLL